MNNQEKWKELTDSEIHTIWQKCIQEGYTKMLVLSNSNLDAVEIMYNFARSVIKASRGE